MAVCAKLSICCLLLGMASTQRICRTVTTGSAAVCEATLGSNWTLLCSRSYQQRNTTMIAWKLPGGSFVYQTAPLTLTNLSYHDAGVYSCTVANMYGEIEAKSNLRLTVEQGGAPMLLGSKSFRRKVADDCEGIQVVRNGVLTVMVTGYPQPTVMWFRDVQRTSRITNDSIYQLLPNGNLLIRDVVQAMEQAHNALYVTAVNDFGMKRYCVHIQWNQRSNIYNQKMVTAKPTVVKSLAYTNLNCHCDHFTCFCKAFCPAHNFLHFILPGLCIGYILLVFIIGWMVILYCQPCYQHCRYHTPVDSESGEDTDVITEVSSVKTDFVYVIYSPQSESWVEHTLMHKLGQWEMRYTTYELAAIPGQPKIVEKLRLSSAANKIIIVLANDSLTEHNFLTEVLQVISNEQTKVIPVLYGVSEEELQSNMIYRSITVYVSIHHTDVNFDIRLKQALI